MWHVLHIYFTYTMNERQEKERQKLRQGQTKRTRDKKLDWEKETEREMGETNLGMEAQNKQPKTNIIHKKQQSCKSEQGL